MPTIPIRLMKDRRYESIPVDRIIVLNSRSREEDQFAQNVRSIQDVGLQKPVLVNERFLKATGHYELVCGEGRLLAHKKLGKSDIPAEVMDCDHETAYLWSLVENIARVPAGTMWFAREIKRLRDAGMSAAEIARIVGRSESSVLSYVTLVERGEERLIHAVEEGVFPIGLAVRIAETPGEEIQSLLMDAFDHGMMTMNNLRIIRSIVEERLRSGAPSKTPPGSEAEGAGETYTVQKLKGDIAKVVTEKKSFISEAHAKEGRLVTLLEGLKTLRSGEDFVALLKAEGLETMPALRSLTRRVRTSGAEKEGVEIHG